MLLVGILSFALGVGLLQVQGALPDVHQAVWLAVPVALAVLLLGKAGPAARAGLAACVALAGVGAGFFWAAAVAQGRLADELPVEWEGRDIRLAGVVASLPQPGARGVRFEFDVERVLTPGARVPARLSLTWYGSGFREAAPATYPELHAGERWELVVRLRRPHGTANPNGFDIEVWLLERGIRAGGYVRLGEGSRRLDALVHRPAYWIERARESLRRGILEALPERPYAGVLVALAVGDQRAIPTAQWTVFTRTGVNHLMSISGLHVTMLAGLAFALVHALWKRAGRLPLALPARKAATLAGFATAGAYALLSGFAVPAQRTVYMLAVVAIALFAGRLASPAPVLAWALAVVLALDPWAVLAPGFWLSFGAVGVILCTVSGRLGAAHWATGFVRVQWAITLALTPLLVALFQQVSLVSPLANAVAIPVVSLAVVPLTLLGALLPPDLPLHVAHGIMALVMVGLQWLAAWPDAVWQQHAPPVWTVLVAVVAAAWLLLPRGFPGRWAGLAGFLPLFLVQPPPLAAGVVELALLDVGQGLAAVVRTADRALLYDAGPAYTPDADAGSRIVVPYLRAAGVRRLDGIVVTHADLDHSGGAGSVLSSVPSDWMISSLPADHALHAQAARSMPCYAGQHWTWAGVAFRVLHPAYDSYTAAGLKSNDRSCVLKVESPHGTVLLAADIEARSERELLARSGDDLQAGVLVVPHHGSTTSSTPEFVERVNPDVAVFTVGYRNRFGHPRQEVVDRYAALGSRIYRSDRDGALILRIGPEGTTVRPWRVERRRYWQQPPAHLAPSPDGLYQ